MKGPDRHAAAYTSRLSPDLKPLITQQYWHINFPLKSQWYTVLHFHNRKNISCFPKNYRKPKSLVMLLAIWFIVYLQLSWECHAFMLTNYTGGALVDQLEKWELYFLHSLNHWLSKINWKPTGDWPFHDWEKKKKKESSTFRHSYIQTHLVFEVTQNYSYWETKELDEHSTLGIAGQKFYTAIARAPIKHQPEMTCLHRVVHCILVLQSIQMDLLIRDWYQPILTCMRVVVPECTNHNSVPFWNCVNVKMVLAHKFTSF